MSLLRARLSWLSRQRLTLLTRQKSADAKPVYWDPIHASYENNTKMPAMGMSFKKLKHHYALIPLLAVVVCSLTWMTYCSWRFLFKMHDADLWKREEPWERFRYKQSKFLCAKLVENIDYKTACQAPQYRS